MDIVIIGSSSLGISTIGIVRDEAKHTLIGVIDDDVMGQSNVGGVPFIGTTDVLIDLLHEKNSIGILIAIGDPKIRYAVKRRIIQLSPNIRFATTIHPKATILGRTRISAGSIVFPGCVIGPSVIIGRSTVVNSNVTIGSGAKIGAFTTICPGAHVGSDASLGIGTYLGMGAAVAQQVSLGRWSTLGALSFAREHVSARSVAVGCLARSVHRT